MLFRSPPPLPVDALIKLQEIQQKMALGLESKRGALADLGEEFPDEKMQEIFYEMSQDAMMNGALDMVRSQINSIIMMQTGIIPGDQPEQAQTTIPGSGSGDNGAGAGPSTVPVIPALEEINAFETNKMLNSLVTQAYGTKLPMRRNPDNNS